MFAAVAVCAAGCGIRPTGVIEGGDPVIARAAVPEMTIYLVSGKSLVPVHRAAIPNAPQAVADVLKQGLSRQEYSRTPSLYDPVRDLSDVRATFDDGVLTFYYTDYSAASRLTLAVITCSAEAQPGVLHVRIVRNGVALQSKKCSSYRDLMAK
jgi:hypothetical protein